jgi:hypothetical protein
MFFAGSKPRRDSTPLASWKITDLCSSADLPPSPETESLVQIAGLQPPISKMLSFEVDLA